MRSKLLVFSVLLVLIFTFGCPGEEVGPSDLVEAPEGEPVSPIKEVSKEEEIVEVVPEPEAPEGVLTYKLNENAEGYQELKGHVYNLGVVSNDPNELKAEYEAGFVQGRLQKNQLADTRDNGWDSAYLVDPSEYKFRPPSEEQLTQAEGFLLGNYNYTVNYAANAEPKVKNRISRILFRILGVYHGATLENPEELDFSGEWLPGPEYFSEEELGLNYESEEVSFLDVYFLNAGTDMWDVVDNSKEALGKEPSRCTAFMKKTEDDMYFAHNTWSCFLDESMVYSYYVAGDYVTFNGNSPGIVTSLSDFGYNGNGIGFLETTHDSTYTEPKVDSLWMFMRAAIAENFAEDLDDFYQMVSLEASGTYMNGYMIYDDKTGEMGLVEMSYESFIYYKSNAEGGYDIVTKPEGLNTEYDEELVQPGIFLGINYPASYMIREVINPVENRPARRLQLEEFIGQVDDIESAKWLITYTKLGEPLSIYGRWDLGFGDTSTPKKVPDGSLDAKAASASMMNYKVEGKLDFETPEKGFWMKYGTAEYDGEPFIWSESDWSDQELRNVPDRVEGEFELTNVYMK